MATRLCWHCKTQTHMTITADPIPEDGFKAKGTEPIKWFALFTCDECGYASMAEMTADSQEVFAIFSQHEHVGRVPYRSDGNVVAKRAAAMAVMMDMDGEHLTWHPPVGHGKEYDNVNAHIASAASEAYSCYFINSYRAAVLMARTTVEAIAKDKGITDGTLQHKIEQMGEQNIIGPQLKDEAHEIRYLGNEMAHGDLDVTVSEQDAADILGFMDTMIDYVYQQPALIEKRRMLRQQRRG
ncbi:DUF4145 domain-containing protein [Bifidobacterium pseudolongum]|nr:DUF4145 domain-containing protein [Bifidobacterium pseudolongum]